MSSPEFYDNFITYQIQSGINDRIYSLYKRLKKSGLHSGSNILEIGCGIGVLTYLVSRKVKNGSIEAMDLSPKSIEYARKHLNKPNISFSSSDIIDFRPSKTTFDKILLFDVLEHVPEENHLLLFNKINSWMNNETQLLINLPNPNYILYDQKNNPEALQETDQPISLTSLTSNLEKASLEIEFFETYNLSIRKDYQFMIIKKKTEFTVYPISNDRNIIQKISARIGRESRKIKFHYPVK